MQDVVPFDWGLWRTGEYDCFISGDNNSDEFRYKVDEIMRHFFRVKEEHVLFLCKVPGLKENTCEGLILAEPEWLVLRRIKSV